MKQLKSIEDLGLEIHTDTFGVPVVFDYFEDAVRVRLLAEKQYYGVYSPQQHLFEQYGIKPLQIYSITKGKEVLLGYQVTKKFLI